ncbi:hypothetical protein LINPERHAP2_LOCUS16834 [Linum perenne]
MGSPPWDEDSKDQDENTTKHSFGKSIPIKATEVSARKENVNGNIGESSCVKESLGPTDGTKQKITGKGVPKRSSQVPGSCKGDPPLRKLSTTLASVKKDDLLACENDMVMGEAFDGVGTIVPTASALH